MQKFMKFSSMAAALALMVTTINTYGVCWFLINQPKMPEGIEKLKCW